MADGSDGGTFRSAVMVASVGIELAVATGIGYLVGDWVDGELGSEPWGMYFFLACGIAAGFLGVVRTARRHWPRD